MDTAEEVADTFERAEMKRNRFIDWRTNGDDPEGVTR